jgi:PKD repeat protein
MKITKKIYTLVLTVFAFTAPAQKEFSKWYFGQNAGLDFSTSPPTILTNGIVNTIEGVATISDSNGNLLFYTDGTGVINNTHSIMANGTGLFGSQASTQSSMIVKQPGSSTIYYIFTTPYGAGTNGARYSIVDMSLAAGLGSVTVKNAPMYTPTCEKQVAVRHCNGRDVWIVSHRYGTNEFLAYLLTSTGLSSSPVISPIGETLAGSIVVEGHLKASPDGKKLAMATYTNSVPASLGSGGFHLFDFDASSGAVSNSLTLLSGTNIPNSHAFGVEFSPDGTKLYGTTSVFSSTNTTGVYQWNICAPGNAAIIASQYSISTGTLNLGSVQWAIDGKLYIAVSSPGTQSLGVINNPNASGAAMNFVLNGQSVAPKYSLSGLPNYINGYTHTVPALFSNTIACQTSSFSVPPVPTFSSGCSSTPYSPSNYAWDFGEPSAGAANSSTLANPAHTYSSTGTYTVTLILYSACTNDTLRNAITLTIPGPTLNVAGNFNICAGEKHTYTVSGASSYQWSNNSTASTVALAPAISTVYSVSGTLNSCTLSKSFTVSVVPCAGISTLENNGAFTIFPNPFKDVISVEATSSSELVIFELNGKLMLKSKLNAGRNEINTSELKEGIYLIQAKNEESVWRGRFVKVE